MGRPAPVLGTRSVRADVVPFLLPAASDVLLAVSASLSVPCVVRECSVWYEHAMETRRLSIRALYTINSREPYLLARSSAKTDVSIIPPHLAPAAAQDGPVIFGKVDLRPCLDLVISSSPEVQPHANLDFSVYVFDLFESHRQGSPSTSPGVAVGHGWLSDALYSPDPILITGTLSCDGVHDDSIEVIFSLREGTRIPLRTNSWGGAERPRAAARRGSGLFTKDPMRFASDPYTKGKQREQRDQSNPPTLPSTPEPSVPVPAPPVPAPVKAEPSSSAVSNPPSAPPGAPAFDPMHFLVAALAGTTGNQQLLTLLSSIDSGAAPNPDVAQILGSLLSSAVAAALPAPAAASTPAPVPAAAPSTQPQPVVAPATATSAPSAPAPTPAAAPRLVPDAPLTFLSAHASSSAAASSPASTYLSPPAAASTPPTTDPGQADDDVVVLDKENVNPTAFKRRTGEKDKGKGKEIARAPPRPTTALRQNKTEPAPRVPSSDNATHSRAGSSSGLNGRKRTLSEIMDERDREREASRKRTTSNSRKPVTSKSSSTSSFGSVLSSHGASTANRNRVAQQSSMPPPPSRTASDPAWEVGSFSSAPAPGPSTSPPRRAASGASQPARRKPYVVPE